MEYKIAHQCPYCKSIEYNGKFVERRELPEEVVIVPSFNSTDCLKKNGSSQALEKRVIIIGCDGNKKAKQLPKKFQYCGEKK